MSALKKPFPSAPSAMSKSDFVNTFGGIYEHSSWVAEGVFNDGLRARHDDVDGLAAAMAHVVDAASHQKKLALINAHPDLAGKAAVAGTLTAESTEEQASAGIDQCNAEEFARFQSFNEKYRRRFGFTFVMAVRNSNRAAILAGYEERLRNDANTEFNRAIAEIHKIAGFRLAALAEASDE